MASASRWRCTKLYLSFFTLTLLASSLRTSLWGQSASVKMTLGFITLNFLVLFFWEMLFYRRQPGEEDGKWLVWISKYNTDGPSTGKGDTGMALICPGIWVWLENWPSHKCYLSCCSSFQHFEIAIAICFCPCRLKKHICGYHEDRHTSPQATHCWKWDVYSVT